MVTFPPHIEAWRGEVAKVWPTELVDKALWVIQWESDGDPNRLGDGGKAVGLFQIHSKESFPDRPEKEWLLIPANNIGYAYLMYKSEGWKPWGGDGNTYNGQPFGALGSHPFPAESGLVFHILPVTGFPITGRFGQTDDAWTPERPHRGVDFGCPEGTTVLAPAEGKVVAFTNDGSFGIGVCLDHEGTPWYSLYAHLSRADVAIGERVSTGTRLGLSGATGRVTGAHLHWQLCRSSAFPVDITQSADPLSFYQEEEDDLADPLYDIRRHIRGLASACMNDEDFAKVMTAYDVLKRNGFVPDDLPNLNPSSPKLSDQFSNLNGVMIRRERIRALAEGDRAREAYEVLKKGA